MHKSRSRCPCLVSLQTPWPMEGLLWQPDTGPVWSCHVIPFYTPVEALRLEQQHQKKKSCNLYICLVLFWSRKNIVEILCVVSPLGEKNATKGAPLPLFSIFSPDIADEFLLTNNHTFWCLNVWVLVMFGSPAVGFLCRRTKHVNLVPTLQGGSRSNFISYCKEITLKSGRRSRVVVF